MMAKQDIQCGQAATCGTQTLACNCCRNVHSCMHDINTCFVLCTQAQHGANISGEDRKDKLSQHDSSSVTHCMLPCRGHSPPGQAVPKQAVGGQASTRLVRSPSEALTALAPSSQGAAAFQHQHCCTQHVTTSLTCVVERGWEKGGRGRGRGGVHMHSRVGSVCLVKTKANNMCRQHILA